MIQDKCMRCGQCCHYETAPGHLKKCKFLITLPSGKTICRIYKSRLGTLLDVVNGQPVICILRKHDKRTFPNCPLNSNTQSLNKTKTQ